MAGLELIICPNCGKDLSSLEAAFVYLANYKNEKVIKATYSEIDIRKLDLIPDIVIYKDILDFLNLREICCRYHTITTAKLKPLYYSS